MTTTSPSTLKKDVVCGMMVDPAKAKSSVEYSGETYYFCCQGCAQKFQAGQEDYLRPKASGPVLVTLGSAPLKTSASELTTDISATAYVCPMCSEIRQSKPGPCPSCGMALEPEIPSVSTKTEYTCPMHPQI